jgi:putative ABC transport system permease protein
MLVMRASVRTRDDPAAATGYIREAVRSVDADLPVTMVKTLGEIVDDSMAQPRFSMLLLAAFGGLAVVLAAIGMYGVISYSVAQRTREIGIRMALGAARASVFRLVIVQGARMATVGIVTGLAASAAITRWMAGFLYGVTPLDPVTFAVVPVLLAGIALVACYVPARRATRVDPVTALRCE